MFARSIVRGAARVSSSCGSSAFAVASAASTSSTAVPALQHLLLASKPAGGIFTGLRFQSTESGKKAEEGVSTSPDEPEEGATKPAEGSSAAAGNGEDPALKALKDENAKLKAANQELTANRLRLLAEMENTRRIAARDVEQAKAYALQSFGKKILDVADNLQRAISSVPASDEATRKTALFEGLAATEKEMIKTLASGGIEQFGKAGEKFDPNRHEAMMQTPADEKNPEGTVTLILKNGFTLKDRVLRAAQVAVSTKM